MMYRFLYVLLLLVPFVAQTGAGADGYWWDCGAASVSMMVEYHTGLEVEPDDFMAAIGRDRYLTAIDLVNLMCKYGLEVAWGDGIPRIVLLNGNHWVVYVGDGYYHDPLRGPCREGYLGNGLYVTNADFDNLDLLEK
jgi:hypothetical protein